MAELVALFQDQVLCLICFNQQYGNSVKAVVSTNLFSSFAHREIATRAYAYWDEFKQAPDSHLVDILEDLIDGTNPNTAKLYQTKIEELAELSQTVNPRFVLDKINNFVIGQSLRSAILEAADFMQRDEVDAAQGLLTKALRVPDVSFNPGTLVSVKSVALNEDFDVLNLGLADLASVGYGPAKGELFVFIALPGRGKSWFLVHTGKFALLQGWKVLHITLEMSEDRVVNRYAQSVTGSSAIPHAGVDQVRLECDDLGRLMSITKDTIHPPTFQDAGFRNLLGERFKSWHVEGNLIVKGFGTNQLTVNWLEAYLDQLYQTAGFKPDIILLDYADLMKTQGKAELRHNLSELYKELRRVAGEREVALVTASQVNRAGTSEKVVTDADIAEDYSKVATADSVMTFSQTDAERQLGLARLYAVKGRNAQDKQLILITQSYATGQFCTGSTLMRQDYWNIIKGAVDAG